MQTSENYDKVLSAFAKFQSEIENPTKNKTAHVSTSKGKDYEYSYSSLDSILDEIKPVANDCGLSISQEVTSESNHVAVTTFILHESGQWLQFGPLSLQIESNGRMNANQAAGSTITYARRYAIESVTGIASQEDTDTQEIGSSATAGSETTLPYGRDKGKPIAEATTDNLEWFLSTLDDEKLNDPKYGENNRQLKKEIEAELEKRNDGNTSPSESLNVEAVKQAIKQEEQGASDMQLGNPVSDDEAQSFAMFWNSRISKNDDTRYKFLQDVTGRDDIQSTSDLLKIELSGIRQAMSDYGKETFVDFVQDYVKEKELEEALV